MYESDQEECAQDTSQTSMMPGTKRIKGKALTGLYVNGNFTEEREEWNQELQQHCEGVYTDPDETKQVLEGRLEYS